MLKSWRAKWPFIFLLLAVSCARKVGNGQFKTHLNRIISDLNSATNRKYFFHNAKLISGQLIQQNDNYVNLIFNVGIKCSKPQAYCTRFDCRASMGYKHEQTFYPIYKMDCNSKLSSKHNSAPSPSELEFLYLDNSDSEILISFLDRLFTRKRSIGRQRDGIIRSNFKRSSLKGKAMSLFGTHPWQQLISENSTIWPEKWMKQFFTNTNLSDGEKSSLDWTLKQLSAEDPEIQDLTQRWLETLRQPEQPLPTLIDVKFAGVLKHGGDLYAIDALISDDGAEKFCHVLALRRPSKHEPVKLTTICDTHATLESVGSADEDDQTTLSQKMFKVLGKIFKNFLLSYII